MKTTLRVALLSLFTTIALTFAACGGVPSVEVQAVQFEGEADARVIVPVVFNGIVVTGEARCAVVSREEIEEAEEVAAQTGESVEGPFPTCAVCVETGDLRVCQCFRGAERVTCPAHLLPLAEEVVVQEPKETVVEPVETEPDASDEPVDETVEDKGDVEDSAEEAEEESEELEEGATEAEESGEEDE